MSIYQLGAFVKAFWTSAPTDREAQPDGYSAGAEVIVIGSFTSSQPYRLFRGGVLFEVPMLTKEYAVALATDHRADVARRIGVFRFKEESILNRRPFYGGASLYEIAREVLHFIDNFPSADFTAPLHIEGNGRRYRRYGRYRRVGQPVSFCQTVRKIMHILDG